MNKLIYLAVTIIILNIFLVIVSYNKIQSQKDKIHMLQDELEQTDRTCMRKAGLMMLNHKRNFHAGLISSNYMEVE